MNKQKVYMNRELSWIKFNERVLEEAENERTPLCERLSFVSIYQSNLDEFFMVRVGSLIDQMNISQDIYENKTHMTPDEQIKAILEQVSQLNHRKDAVYEKLIKQLERYGIKMVDLSQVSKKDRDALSQLFTNEIAPLISPMIVGKRQPFPFLRNREIYAIAILEKKKGKEKLGIIPCSSSVFSRLISIPGTHGCHVLSEDIILNYISEIFASYTVKTKALIRVTRNADIDADSLYDEDVDYRDFMVELIKKRKRLAPVRLEISRKMDGHIINMLCDYLKMDMRYVFQVNTPMDLSFLFQIQDKLRHFSQLFYEKRIPQMTSQFKKGMSIIEQIKEKDKLLSYPYDSMKPFLELLREAANDPEVISIKMTLYRMARQSKVVEYLIEAAENGKDVFVLVELKARFDEENNIEWSRRLEHAGCRVIYGLGGYKVHSKLCLITRKTQGQLEYITQVGTGNYNEKTARLYTDLCLMSANKEIGQEASSVFTALAMGETVKKTKHLLVAPHCLQNRILEMIDEEIEYAKKGEKAYLGVKINSLTDKKIIDRLILASKAGVKIEMIVRGICCLIPKIKGETDNIRIISIVGRYLEHSRIYIFGCGKRQKIYIASADYMTRNTLRRVEVACPIYDEDIQRRVYDMFQMMLNDNQQARELQNVGNYQRVINNNPALNIQEYFFEQAYLHSNAISASIKNES